MTRLIIMLSFACLVIPGCGKKDEPVVQKEDYYSFIADNSLPGKKLVSLDTEISFWASRLELNAEDIAARMKLASLFAERFDYSGNINELHTADSLYRLVHEVNKVNSSATYRSLAYLSIKQHEFRRAKSYLDSALGMGDDKYETMLSLFDVLMELGQTSQAETVLAGLAGKGNVPYMIRQAKLEDHKGDLDKAISIIEEAAKKVSKETELPMYLWIHSNLGDMYGHANRFSDAYKQYLEVLQEEPGYYHCLKGIAWLAFSHDKNIDDAKTILMFLKKKHAVPDYDLLLAEIATYEKNNEKKSDYTASFLNRVSSPIYGKMYNSYTCDIKSPGKDRHKALAIAESEVNERPTGESFALLAWSYYHNNEIDRSLEIIKAHLENKSHEPGILYKIGMIYYAAGNRQKAKKFLAAAYESSFELGPVTTLEIEKVLQTI